MTRRDVLTGLGGVAVGSIGGGITSALLPRRQPSASPFAAATAATDDPPGPRSGIVEQISFYSPSGAGGPFYLLLFDGVDKRWPVTLKPWETNSEITWNQFPVTADDLAGYLVRHQANVIYWPLTELDGACIKADFTQVGPRARFGNDPK